MKKLLLGLFILGLTTQIYAQAIELSEINIATNYKYLDAIDSEKAAIPVKKLQEKVLSHCNKTSEMPKMYDDEYETYKVSFYIPEGKIVAAYNKDGDIIRTIERYKNVRLPKIVLQAIAKRFPNWAVVEDTYLINFHCEKGITKKMYKIKIENADKVVDIKTDEKGNFI